MDDATLRTLRMDAHGLSGAGRSTPAVAVSRLLAVQAQNLADASWSIGLRVLGSTAATVAAEINRGAIIRTWTMRGTLHLVATTDARWLLSLLAPRAHAARATIWRQADLSEKVFRTAGEIAAKRLSRHRRLSRPDLIRAFNEGGIAAVGERASHIIRFLSETQIIVPGPPDGKPQTFALFDDWVPASPEKSRDESLSELAVRYIEGHGPATDRGLAWWSGLTVRDSARALSLASDRLTAVAGRVGTYYLQPDVGVVSSAIDDRHPTIRLIPGFDEYHIGYENRLLILDDERKSVVGPAKNGLFKAPLLRGGRIEGIWSRRIEGRRIVVGVSPFDPRLGLAAAELEPTRRRYEKFMNRPVDITLQQISTST